MRYATYVNEDTREPKEGNPTEKEHNTSSLYLEILFTENEIKVQEIISC